MITSATHSTDVYVSEHRSGAIPSLTLAPGGKERSVMRRHFPVLRPFGITPNRLTWHGGREGRSAGENGPNM